MTLRLQFAAVQHVSRCWHAVKAKLHKRRCINCGTLFRIRTLCIFFTRFFNDSSGEAAVAERFTASSPSNHCISGCFGRWRHHLTKAAPANVRRHRFSLSTHLDLFGMFRLDFRRHSAGFVSSLPVVDCVASFHSLELSVYQQLRYGHNCPILPQ